VTEQGIEANDCCVPTVPDVFRASRGASCRGRRPRAPRRSCAWPSSSTCRVESPRPPARLRRRLRGHRPAPCLLAPGRRARRVARAGGRPHDRLGEDALWPPSGARHCYRRRGDGRGASSRASGGETPRDAARGVRHLSRRDVPAQVDARRLRPAGDGSDGAASPSSSRSTRSPRWTTGHGDPTPRVQQRSMATVIRRALRPDGVPSEHFRPDGVPQDEGAAVRAALTHDVTLIWSPAHGSDAIRGLTAY
jgi:hypothetical protein